MSLSGSHILIGNRGENIAVEYLIMKGFSILERNYRYKRAEIDVIASIENVLVFVEVKTRSSTKFGNPEDAVTGRKSKKVISAAENYIEESGWQKDIRFDVVSINLGTTIEIEHIEDAFF